MRKARTREERCIERNTVRGQRCRNERTGKDGLCEVHRRMRREKIDAAIAVSDVVDGPPFWSKR